MFFYKKNKVKLSFWIYDSLHVIEEYFKSRKDVSYECGLYIDPQNKNFGHMVAVEVVSIEMDSGLYGLLGSNGAGKTTLMRMLCTVLRPLEGQILYNGTDIFKLGERYRDILGYLPQEFGYYPELKVIDYLGYIASLKGLRRSFAMERIDELLELVGMQNHTSSKMKALSGGMKRRVGIAQSMLNDPEILVLDEPTSGLDPKERIRFRNLIDRLANDRIVLLSTHIVSDIEAIAKKVFIMKDGKIINQGSVEELYNSIPVSPWICRGSNLYAYTYMQTYMTILLAGYIGNILAAVTAMLVSARSRSAILAMCVPFMLFILSPFIGRVIPFKEFFNITPDQLMNVYNCIRLPLIYQFGGTAVMQIPMLITLYSCIAMIIIPFIYRIFSRYSVR